MTVAAPVVAADAMRHCREVTRHRARNFYYGLKLLPEPKRSAMYAVYAWMRHADDLADDPHADRTAAMQRIESFRAATECSLRGDPPSDDLTLVGISEVARRFPLKPRHFHAMLDGQLDDLEIREYESFASLRAYCERVASSVGLVCISIWGYRDRRAESLAVERGLAFQLTNILRDISQDLDAGRSYLPSDAFQRHQIDRETLRRWADPERCEQFLRDQVERAQQYYDSSRELDDLIEADSRPTLWAMTEIYHQILDKVRQNPKQAMTGPRIRLSAVHKGTIAVRARWRLRGSGSGSP